MIQKLIESIKSNLHALITQINWGELNTTDFYTLRRTAQEIRDDVDKLELAIYAQDEPQAELEASERIV